MASSSLAKQWSQSNRRDRNNDRNSIYDAHVRLDAIGGNVRRNASCKGQALAQMVHSAQMKLSDAQGAIRGLQDVANPWDKSREGVETVLSPLRDISKVVNAIADAHPAIKVLANVVSVLIDLELCRRRNDMQIAVTFYEMSLCLLVLADIDHIYEEGRLPSGFLTAFEAHMTAIIFTTKAFAAFCEMYYKRNALVKMCRSGTYKERLAGYVVAFDNHKRELHMDISTHASLKAGELDRKMVGLAIDVNDIKSLLLAKSDRERRVAAYLDREGGLDAVLQDKPKINELLREAGETQTVDKLDMETLEALREGIDQTLGRYMKTNELTFQYAAERLEMSIRLSFGELLSSKLEEGAHQLIEDAEIRSVWQKMKASTSVNTRVFLNALQEHFYFEAVKYEAQYSTKSPNHWALHFLSKMIFYPAIGDVLDEDLSGFISLNEVNNFLVSRPPELGCNSLQWIAFWGFGPYKTNVELVEDIKDILEAIKHIRVLPENERRTQYFRGVTQRLRMISVHTDIVDYLGETDASSSNYADFEKVRRAWKTLELNRIEANLKLIDYTLPGAEAFVLVLGNRRLEHYILFLIFVLLRRHLKVIFLAQRQLISVKEFTDMRASWECLFRVFDERLNLLLKVWRQHRLELASHVETYAGGLFEQWYHFRTAMIESYADDEEHSREGSDAPSHHYEEGRRRMNTLGIGHSPQVGGNPRRSSLIDRVDVSILNHPTPTHVEDDSMLELEEEIEWDRLDRAERKERAELKLKIANIERMLSVVVSHLQLGHTADNRRSSLLHPSRSETLRPDSYSRNIAAVSPVLTDVQELSLSPENSRPPSPTDRIMQDETLSTEEIWMNRSPRKQKTSAHVGQATPELQNGQHNNAARADTYVGRRTDSSSLPPSISRASSEARGDQTRAPRPQGAPGLPRSQMLPPPPPPPPPRTVCPPGSGNGTPLMQAFSPPPARNNQFRAPPTPITPNLAPPLAISQSISGSSSPGFNVPRVPESPYTYYRNDPLHPSPSAPAMQSRTPSNTLPPHGFATQLNTPERGLTFPVPATMDVYPTSGYSTPAYNNGAPYGSPHAPAQYGY